MRFTRLLFALPAAAILAATVWSCRPDSPTSVYLFSKVVTGQVNHFSRYAVAW